jgi:DNA-binding transcriptional LysR family regulator
MVGRTGITYHQLQTFLAVARTGNLTKVARELNATQPTVSLQLSSLRKSLGIPLFERPGGRFRLTPAGERLRRYAEETLEGLRAMQQDIAVLKGSLAGSLAVGVTHFAVNRVMPQLPRFRAQFPAVNIQVHVDRPEPLFTQLLAETLDAVCFLKMRTPPGLALEPFGQEELVIIVSSQHRLARRRRVSAAELSEDRLVVSNVSAFRELVEENLRAVGVTPRVVDEVQNYEAVKEQVERNMGYSMHIKHMVAAELAAGQLVELQLDGPAILGELVVGFRSRPTTSPLTQEFARFLRAERSRSRGSGASPARRRTTTRGRASPAPRPGGRPRPSDC